MSNIETSYSHMTDLLKGKKEASPESKADEVDLTSTLLGQKMPKCQSDLALQATPEMSQELKETLIACLGANKKKDNQPQ